MTTEEPLEITIEVTRKEIDDLFDLRFDRASFLTRELRSLIERIREEYYAHIDVPDQWGNEPGSPMYGVPPEGDPFWKENDQ